ncbi:hypothetical protein Q1695_004786 [Nippostrongylus brasiliensis]|nr:hypothetical protein Q1695_004786 [Nippostrongylus brasiliensis]
MLAECCRSAASVAKRFISAVLQTFWTTYYFAYFLLKPHPEWKCDKHPTETQRVCCVEAQKVESKQSTHQISLQSTALKTNEPKGFAKISFWTWVKGSAMRATNAVALYARRIGRLCYRLLCKIGRALRTVGQYVWAILKALFIPNVKSMPLTPSTPKPFQTKPLEPPSFNKVEFNPEELLEGNAAAFVEPIVPGKSELEKTTHQMITEDPSNLSYQPEARMPPPIAMPRHIGSPEAVDMFNSAQRFTDTSLDVTQREMSPYVEENTIREPSPPSRVPPAPPPPPSKPTRIDSSYGREDVDPWENEAHTANQTGVKKEPPGIGKLPANVMAELHGTQKMRQEREASVQREMTQSCHPDMAQWNNESRYDRSATATPFRASSVGPTMRKLEQVVSRLEDSSDNEAQYVFRAKPSDYIMGKSVFLPVEEAERMRDTINRTSRPVTPAHSVVSGRVTPSLTDFYGYGSEDGGGRRRARTVGPIGRESMSRTSGFYATSPVTSHTVRRTPVPYDRGANFAYDRDQVTQGAVNYQVRRWPPVSNASGVEIARDNWVEKMAGHSEDGLITTMCRRVVERKTEDNWKWHDDHGHVVDEKKQKTHWSRTVELLPTGDTRFQDVSRQYNRNYVVESIVRNY